MIVVDVSSLISEYFSLLQLRDNVDFAPGWFQIKETFTADFIFDLWTGDVS